MGNLALCDKTRGKLDFPKFHFFILILIFSWCILQKVEILRNMCGQLEQLEFSVKSLL